MSSNPGNIGIIVSSGRTGTNFLAEYLDKNFDDVTALHEPKPSYAIRLYSNAYTHGKVSDEQMVQLVQRKRKKIMASITTPTYIESNPYLHGFIPVIDQVWPHCKIIHIVRDPRTFITSGLNHQDAHFYKKFANQWFPNWVPNVKRILNIKGTLSPIGYYAAYWRVLNESIQTNGEKTEHYHRFLYEHVFEGNCPGLSEICTVFSLNIKDSKGVVSSQTRINKSQSSRTSDWSTWTPKQCAEIHQICSPLMQQYGYGLDQPWLDRVEEGMAQ